MTDRTPDPRPGGVPPPSKHQLSLMIWLCVFPTLTVVNLALGDWLKTLTPVLRTFVLATIAVPIVIYGLMSSLHRLRFRLMRSSKLRAIEPLPDLPIRPAEAACVRRTGSEHPAWGPPTSHSRSPQQCRSRHSRRCRASHVAHRRHRSPQLLVRLLGPSPPYCPGRRVTSCAVSSRSRLLARDGVCGWSLSSRPVRLHRVGMAAAVLRRTEPCAPTSSARATMRATHRRGPGSATRLLGRSRPRSSRRSRCFRRGW